MGIVAKQSVRNALVLSTGLVLGAVNTYIVLTAPNNRPVTKITALRADCLATIPMGQNE